MAAHAAPCSIGQAAAQASALIPARMQNEGGKKHMVPLAVRVSEIRSISSRIVAPGTVLLIYARLKKEKLGIFRAEVDVYAEGEKIIAISGLDTMLIGKTDLIRKAASL